MNKYLIVNADDFGYSYSVNKGIIEAHTNGIVTSTSVLVDSIAAQEAKDLVKFPNLSIGLHLEISTEGNVKQEIGRQLRNFNSIVGREPDHIDTHKRSIDVQGVKEALESYAKNHKTPVRNFGHAKFIEDFFGFRSEGDLSVGRLKKAIDQATDEYNELMCHVGYSDDYLREHSSYNDPREEELKSICSSEIKSYIKQSGLTLVNWKEFKEMII